MSDDKKQGDYGAVVGETWTGTDEQIDRNIRANSGADWHMSKEINRHVNSPKTMAVSPEFYSAIEAQVSEKKICPMCHDTLSKSNPEFFCGECDGEGVVSKDENMIYLPPLDISAPVPEGMKKAVRFFAELDLKEKRIEMILSDAFGAPFDDTDQRMADAKWGALACIRIDRERIWNNLYAQPYNDTPVGAERARKVIFEEEE
jgi:hypothetical protein